MMAVLDGVTPGEVLAACAVLLPLLDAQEDGEEAALAVLALQFKAMQGLEVYERSLFRYRARPAG